MGKTTVIIFIALFHLTVHGNSSYIQHLNVQWEKLYKTLVSTPGEANPIIWQQWIDSASEHKIESPQSYYNLGYAHWRNSELFPAIINMLKAASLRLPTPRQWEELNFISQIERTLGLSDPVSESLLFRFKTLLSPSVISILLALTFWSLAGIFIIPWGKVRKEVSWCSHIILIGIGLSAASISLVNWITYRHIVHFGVMKTPVGGKEMIRVYLQPDINSKDPIELPPGTVVRLGTSERGFYQILQPTLGWVQRNCIVKL